MSSTLIEASDSGDWATVNLLLPNADVSLRDEYGYTAFLSAVARGYLDIVREFLFRAPCVVNDRTRCRTTALMMAANYGYEEIVDLLLEYPETKYDDVNVYGLDALSMAIATKHHDIVDKLIRHGAKNLE